MTQLYFTTDCALLFATINMAVAVGLGAIIGSERQLRGRMAGLRTNALVALGASAFVTFAALFPNDMNPTRVAAQVVSGIGFLGAGIIFRDGFDIKGINTAATLWCSAAVGLISGAGHMSYAIVLTGFIVFINLGLRPVVRKLKQISAKSPATDQVYQLRIGCRDENQQAVRAALFDAVGAQGLSLVSTHAQAQAQDGTTQIMVLLSGLHGVEGRLEHIILQMSRLATVVQAEWQMLGDSDESEP